MNNLKELINAVLDGRTIQWDFTPQSSKKGWEDAHYINQTEAITAICRYSDYYSYRIKPEKKVVQYRNYLHKEGKMGVWTGEFTLSQALYETCSDFGKWIGDVQEYEVKE